MESLAVDVGYYDPTWGTDLNTRFSQHMQIVDCGLWIVDCLGQPNKEEMRRDQAMIIWVDYAWAGLSLVACARLRPQVADVDGQR
jgi:hypothetical protein